MWLGDNVGLVLNDIFYPKYALALSAKKVEIKAEKRKLKQKWEREKIPCSLAESDTS